MEGEKQITTEAINELFGIKESFELPKSLIARVRERLCRHRYSDDGLDLRHYGDVTVICNICTKCGHKYIATMPRACFDVSNFVDKNRKSLSE